MDVSHDLAYPPIVPDWIGRMGRRGVLTARAHPHPGQPSGSAIAGRYWEQNMEYPSGDSTYLVKFALR